MAAFGPCHLPTWLRLEARGTRRKPSPKNLGECLIIIPYQNCLSYPHNGSAEIAGRPEHQPGQDIVCRRRAVQINRGHFLTFGSNEGCAARAMANASVRPSFRLAGTVSCIAIPRASRNPEAFAQVVQPLR